MKNTVVKNTIRKVSKVVIFGMILVLFLNQIYHILSWKDTGGDYYSSMNSFYDLEKDVVDVLFLGSSRCYCSMNQAVLWEEQGIASFALAISGQDLASSYHCFQEALKTQSPQVVCLELYGATFHGYAVDSNIYRNTLSYKPSRNAFSAVKSIAEDKKKDLLLKWPIVHTRYAELKKEDFQAKQPVYLGYHAEFETQWVEPLCTYHGTEMLPIGEEEEQWIRKIIALAEETDTNLVFFVAPFVSSEENQKMYNYVQAIAEEHDIPFLNMSKMQEKLQLDQNTDFIDWAHTNYYGAKKASSYMGTYLMEKFDLPDRRGDVRYDLWYENSKVRKHEYDNRMLLQQPDIGSYLESISGLEDYTIILTANGNFYAEEAAPYEALSLLGLEDFYEDNGLWILENGQVIQRTAGGDFFEHRELKDGDLTVSSASGISTVVIDKQPYTKVENGMNIVVYDQLLSQVVDAVGFDATNGYTMVR